MMFPKDLPARRFSAWVHRCLLGLALVACAAGAEPPAGGKIFLWEVKSATNSLYVFGSVHVAKPDFYPLPRPVEEAYRQADQLVVEADVSDQARMAETVPLLTYVPPDSLDKHVSPQVWKQLEAASTQAKQDVETLKPLKPAVVASAMVLGALAAHGYDSQAGVDLHFLSSAHADAKQVVELESVEYQAGVLGGLTDEEGDAMLSETLQEIRTGELVRNTDRIVAAWKAGDVESIAGLLREANKDPASKKIFAKLFDERNPAMAQKIAALASGSKHTLVVIGAGHLAGEKSVLQLLQAKGLRVRQLP
jgi:uncharacterized protein YbaP (TraB family)